MLHGTDEQVPTQFMKLHLWPFQITTSGIAGDVMVRQFDLRGSRIIEQLQGEHIPLRSYINLYRHHEQYRTDAESLLKQFLFGAVMFVQGLAEELGLQPETLKTPNAEVIH
jgi:hypothetical protein